jgi:hypothetical protein
VTTAAEKGDDGDDVEHGDEGATDVGDEQTVDVENGADRRARLNVRLQRAGLFDRLEPDNQPLLQVLFKIFLFVNVLPLFRFYVTVFLMRFFV